MYDDEVTGTPTYEWRVPTKSEYRNMSPDCQDHADRGGLFIYPIVAEQAEVTINHG